MKEPTSLGQVNRISDVCARLLRRFYTLLTLTSLLD